MAGKAGHLTKQQFVYTTLRESIIRCELGPGTRLVIDDLARQFKVSIIPVREALRLLQSEGLVLSVAHVGATVAPIARASVVEVFTLLEGLEVVAARIAAERATAADFETVFGYAAHNGANLDIGHFVAGQNTSPVPFITKHHSRITHIHVKDRKMNNGANVPFGEGDTPIREVLQLIRDNKWDIQATIEFEYPVPEGSTRMAEIRKSIDYCRAALA